jgi:hypothetical protein
MKSNSSGPGTGFLRANPLVSVSRLPDRARKISAGAKFCQAGRLASRLSDRKERPLKAAQRGQHPVTHCGILQEAKHSGGTLDSLRDQPEEHETSRPAERNLRLECLQNDHKNALAF